VKKSNIAGLIGKWFAELFSSKYAEIEANLYEFKYEFK
jgi:hypothetical protein|tara:strand:+ start:3684 stop:3797 length:114 start_codon:yes stop_codon:yes gene_type:complete